MSVDNPILTISVAAKLLDLHPRTLMLYEQYGLVSPYRTSTNRRMFSIKALNELQFIKFLTHDKGINLHGAKIVLEAITLAEKVGTNLKTLLFPTFTPKKLI